MAGFDDYLEHEIQSASGVELRRLLLQKAVGLCDIVRLGWSGGDQTLGDQWMIRIHDILIELLDGVHDRQNDAAAAVTDLYIFLLKLSNESAAARSVEGVRSIQQVLEIELETWTLMAKGQQPAGEVPMPPTSQYIAGDLYSDVQPDYAGGLDLTF